MAIEFIFNECILGKVRFSIREIPQIVLVLQLHLSCLVVSPHRVFFHMVRVDYNLYSEAQNDFYSINDH